MKRTSPKGLVLFCEWHDVDSKTVKQKLDFNLDKFDSSKELDDSLNDVRSLMKNYK